MSANADKQITQMVRFIMEEASEKAREIGIQAKEDFTIEKQRLVQEQKSKIRADYTTKKNQIVVQKKIKKSRDIKDNRLQMLKVKNLEIQKINEGVIKALSTFIQDTKTYNVLLCDLMVQAMISLTYKTCKVYVRECDQKLAVSMFDEAEKKYAVLTNKKCALSLGSISISDGSYGGCIISAFHDKIKCDNTLKSRMNLVFEQLLPEIKMLLFDEKRRELKLIDSSMKADEHEK